MARSRSGSVLDPLLLPSYLTGSEELLFRSWLQSYSASRHSSRSTFEEYVASIPAISQPSYLPAICFFTIIENYDECWSIFDIIDAYTRLWSTLPESAKSFSDPTATKFARQLEKQVVQLIKGPTQLFRSSDSPAIVDPTTKRILSHNQLSTFIQNFRLPTPLPKDPTVVLALPNGYLLGLACVTVSCYYATAPINIAGGAKQFRSDVEVVKPQVILVLEQDFERLDLDKEWVANSEIQILIVDETQHSTFTIRMAPTPPEDYTSNDYQPNAASDVALVLLTSGTSGTKKVVPVTMFSLLTGISCVMRSWGLSAQDSCINMMPLNHVGGLVRNLFAPVFSGGSTLLCPSFDPNLFWDLLQDGQGTWYYASPSMHTSILAEKEFRRILEPNSKLRLVCNAAGALLPALALRLKDCFKCTVLPSYGMTECMPISTPPLDYTLDRPGTSGVVCGPEVIIMDSEDVPLPALRIGRICVRGGPTFGGYLQNKKVQKTSLTLNRWFDTGDLGYLDSDGYLFLTGRGKEVINRGGEIISPFEVEEAITTASQTSDSVLYQRVKAVLAFSAPHEVLQEVVGVIIVPHPSVPKPDLRILNIALKNILHPSKIPAAIVYMNALPMSNNKVLRIRLAERLNICPIRDNMKLLDKHYDATCPPLSSSLDTKITNSKCSIDCKLIQKKIAQCLRPGLKVFVRLQPQDGLSEVFIAPDAPTRSPTELRNNVYEHLNRNLDGLHIPTNILILDSPIPLTASGLVDENALYQLVKQMKFTNSKSSFTPTEIQVKEAMATVLNIPSSEIGVESDFFHLGGDSLNAGRLLSTLRRDYNIHIPVHQLFTASSVSAIATLADSMRHAKPDSKLPPSQEIIDESIKTHSSTNPIVMAIHLLPIAVLFPMKLAFWWSMFIYSLTALSTHWKNPHIAARFITLIIALTTSSLCTQIAAPICGISFKWIIIGRYKAGKYPMWGSYHTRWWIVDKLLMICGQGVFEYHNSMRLVYFRLLGAKIGTRVMIEPGTNIGEYDLLEIADDVLLDRCTCRPFACERNTTMLLDKIVLGRNSSVGLKSQVAPGSRILEDTCIGPNSSSFEMDHPVEDNRGTTNGKLPEPHTLLHIFVIFPIKMMVRFLASLPWMAALAGVVADKPIGKTHHGLASIILWWATPHRIVFHYLARVLDNVLGPIVRFVMIVVVKRLLDAIVGKSQARAIEDFSQAQALRTAIIDALLPMDTLHKVSGLFGSHYEVTSIAARALGAKVGKRVYWPGTGPSIQDYDLVQIGDDVVFGSRSHIITRDGYGSAPVKIDAGSMIADRVILAPGSLIGQNTVLGSGATTKREQQCAPDTVWIGNKNGSAVSLSQSKLTDATVPRYRFKKDASFSEKEVLTPSPQSLESFGLSKWKATPQLAESDTSDTGNISSTPFGRAFYEHNAPYFVFNQFVIFLYSTAITIFAVIYWDVGTISSIILARLLQNSNILEPERYRSFVLYAMITVSLSAILIFLSTFSLLMVVAAKWILLGRRKPGNYDWDKSSYCQRWQVFLAVEAIRARCFKGIGVLGMITGTQWIVLYYRAMGATIGKNCAIFASGRPSALFTEPDLLVIGDRVAIDDASLVSHINSRGKFDLRDLHVGDGAVLRSGTRLLSGARMGKRSVLLEHTLIMAGDVADDGVVYQGWPADVFNGDRFCIESTKAEK